MNQTVRLASNDAGLIKHWRSVIADPVVVVDSVDALFNLAAVEPIVWLDLSLPGLPSWADDFWQVFRGHGKIVAASSNPSRDQALKALSAGCAGYCHAFADRYTLSQIQAVVRAGGVWIGQDVMNQLLVQLHNVQSQNAEPHSEGNKWSQLLTVREAEVARLAAEGLSNRDISQMCGITERTVKAHLTVVFEKIQVSDRLQLALKVHGIHASV